MFLIADYVERVEAFWTLLALEIYRVSLVQCLETTLLNRRKMHKNIFASRALDEAVPFGAVKPFHYTTFSHKYSPSWIIVSHAPMGGLEGSQRRLRERAIEAALYPKMCIVRGNATT